jgi:hypothetical protein
MLTAATLVVGAITAPATQSAYAYQQKKGGGDNGKGNGNGNTVAIEECKNRGSSNGFDAATNQECENLICTHPGNNSTCVQEGVKSAVTPTPVTPVKLTCEQCFMKFLTPDQIDDLLFHFDINTIAQLCNVLGVVPESAFRDDLSGTLPPVSETTANELIACLKNAGIVFATT